MNQINAIADSAFSSLFTKFHAFTILFEDSELDQRILNLNPNSTVLSVAAAGCGVASMLAHNPKRIDAVDINRHHLAITAIKVAAAQRLRSYDDFYQLLGYGTHSRADHLIKSILSNQPGWIQKYWHRNQWVFRKGFYRMGIFSRMSSTLRKFTQVNETWLRNAIQGTPEDRTALITDACNELKRNPLVKSFVESPIVLLGCGINFRQKKQNLNHWKTHTILDVFTQLAHNVIATDWKENWILWHCVAGHFDHDQPNCRPPYLRKKNHALSLRNSTQVHYRAESIFSTLQRSGPNHWSHYNLSDIVDWMPEQVQRHLFLEVHRTSKDDSFLLYRSVEDCDLIEKLGLCKYFELVKPVSQHASSQDRSKLYQRVNLYRKIS